MFIVNICLLSLISVKLEPITIVHEKETEMWRLVFIATLLCNSLTVQLTMQIDEKISVEGARVAVVGTLAAKEKDASRELFGAAAGRELVVTLPEELGKQWASEQGDLNAKNLTVFQVYVYHDIDGSKTYSDQDEVIGRGDWWLTFKDGRWRLSRRYDKIRVVIAEAPIWKHWDVEEYMLVASRRGFNPRRTYGIGEIVNSSPPRKQ